MPRTLPTLLLSRRRALALVVLAAARAAVAQNNATVCPTDQLDWYSSVVGESPCRTYERLRQICDSRYAVGQFASTTPGDTCDSQLHLCCCNSVAWNLSMLCMNCQRDGSVTADAIGIDAGSGAYSAYLAGCGVPTNGSLPTTIQAAVCSAQIDIRPTLYDADWMDTGAWFYTFYREAMESALKAVPQKNLTSCPSTSSSSPLPPSTSAPTHSSTATTSLTPSTTSPSSTAAPSANALNVGAIAGGVAGGVVALLLLVAAALWWRRRVRRQHLGDAISHHEHDGQPVLEPFLDGADAAAPPPYMEDPRKGAPRRTQAHHSPPPSAYGPSHSGSGAGSGSGSGSAWGGSSAAIGAGAGSAAGSQAGVAPTTDGSRRAREKGSGWRLSEKQPPPSSP